MQRDYDYKGYSIRVVTETVHASALGKVMMEDRGYLTVVEIYRPRGLIPCFPQLRLADHDDRRFATEVDALMGGYSAGRRVVDDVLSARIG